MEACLLRYETCNRRQASMLLIEYKNQTYIYLLLSYNSSISDIEHSQIIPHLVCLKSTK